MISREFNEWAFNLKEVDWSQVDGERKSIGMKDDSLTITILNRLSANGKRVYLQEYRVNYTDPTAGKRTCLTRPVDNYYLNGKHPMLHSHGDHKHIFGCVAVIDGAERDIAGLYIKDPEYEIDGDQDKIRERQFNTKPYNLD